MKKSKQTLFNLAVSALAVIMAIQVPVFGATPRINPVLADTSAFAVKAASKAEDTVAVPVIATVADETAQTVLPAETVISPAVSTVKTETQKADNADYTAQAAFNEAPAADTAAEPVGQETAAAAQTEPLTILPGILYDADDNVLLGPDGKGLVYIGFDFDIDQNVFYSSLDPWQKGFGYNTFYDVFAPLGTIFFKTRSVYFNYNGLDWMVKLWKGQYGITSGAEVGIYTKSPNVSIHYNGASEENFVKMDLRVYKNDQLYFTRDPQMHWWLSGFVLGDVVTPDEINIETTITFKDRDMTDAFIAALNAQTDTKDVAYVVKDAGVNLQW